MTVASSSAEVETNFGPFIRNFGTPDRFTPDEDRYLAKPTLGQEPLEEDDVAENVRGERGGAPISGQVHRLRANDTSVHDQRVDGSVDGRQASADRTQIGNVHDNNVEDAPASLGFKLGLRCPADTRTGDHEGSEPVGHFPDQAPGRAAA